MTDTETPEPGDLHRLRDALARVPAPDLPPIDDALIESSVAYLASDAALRSLDHDTYWPKWDSPWWHMLLLHELGEARRIPAAVVTRMVEGLDALPIHVFPIHPHDRPPDSDPYRDSTCHCAVGCIHQVLTGCGVDVAAALPWTEPWFARYQMADGGANCDETAYLADECASSMVGTIAGFEAMLAGPPSPVCDGAAGFLIERRLTEGSPSRHNAEERAAAPAWLAPCLPRFYFYDVLRGLTALVRWAEVHGRTVPIGAVAGVIDHLVASFPDGVVRVRRRAHLAHGTIARVGDRWVRGQAASSFALLDAMSTIGRACPVLSRHWSEARAGLLRLIEAGRVAV